MKLKVGKKVWYVKHGCLEAAEYVVVDIESPEIVVLDLPHSKHVERVKTEPYRHPKRKGEVISGTAFQAGAAKCGKTKEEAEEL